MSTPFGSYPFDASGVDSFAHPQFIMWNRAPTINDIYTPGTQIQDNSVTPPIIYQTSGAGNWDTGGIEPATTTTYGTVILTDNSEPVATKAYADALAIAGAPVSTTTVAGIGQLATDAEAVAGTASTPVLALFITPSNLAAVFAAPPATGGTTPAAGAFTTLAFTTATGSAGGTWDSGGTALNIGADASNDVVNLGTGGTRTVTLGAQATTSTTTIDAGTGGLNLGTTGAKTITIGNVTAGTAVAVNTGTGSFTVTTTGAGDIVLNSDDTMLLDSDGVLELNSSAGAISIGNDADSQNINVGTAGTRLVTIGNVTASTSVAINVGTNGFALDGVASSQYTIGAATTTGTVTIGGTAQTGDIVLGSSSGTNAVKIMNGSGAGTLSLGVVQTAGAINAGTGMTTGTITIGGTAQTGNITLGSSSGTNAVRIMNGSGAGTLSLGVVQTAGAINMGTAMTTGTITVGGTGLQTGTISIAPGTGAQTVNIATGGTGIKTVNIGTAAIDNVITIGTVTGAASLSLLVGTGNFSLNGAATSTYTFAPSTTSGTINFGGTGANTGTMTIAGGTGAQTLNIANSTGGKTVAIATGAGANTVSLGSTNTTSTTTINSGSGNTNVTGGHLVIASTARTLLVNGGAVTDFIGTGTLSSGTVTIANTNIATGDMIIPIRIDVNGSTTLGELTYTISNATSFTVTSVILGTPGSTQTADTSTFAYFIIRPF